MGPNHPKPSSNCSTSADMNESHEAGPVAYQTRAPGGEWIECRKDWYDIVRSESPDDARALCVDNQTSLEMRIFELRHVILRPNRPYVFTVDPNCENCRRVVASGDHFKPKANNLGDVDKNSMTGFVPANDRERGLQDALVAIAGMSSGHSEERVNGHEDAYRVIECLAFHQKDIDTVGRRS